MRKMITSDEYEEILKNIEELQAIKEVTWTVIA